jgi:hypothetical protein
MPRDDDPHHHSIENITMGDDGKVIHQKHVKCDKLPPT